MKLFTRFAKVSLVAVGSLLIVIAFTGCDSGMFPFTPETELDEEAKEVFVPQVNTTAPQSISYESFEAFAYGEARLALAAPKSMTSWIEKDKGGKLKLEFKLEMDEEKKLELKCELKIHKYSIPQDMELKMSVDPDKVYSDLDVVFGPHGLKFSEDADLHFEIKGKKIHLDGINPENVWIYYDNKEDGCWEKMQCEKLKIKIEDDKFEIKLEKAKLPHFSRYALSKG